MITVLVLDVFLRAVGFPRMGGAAGQRANQIVSSQRGLRSKADLADAPVMDGRAAQRGEQGVSCFKGCANVQIQSSPQRSRVA